MLADIAHRDGETHTAILERGDAKRARAEAEPLLERIGPTGRILEAAGEIAVLDKGPQGMTLQWRRHSQVMRTCRPVVSRVSRSR